MSEKQVKFFVLEILQTVFSDRAFELRDWAIICRSMCLLSV